MQLPQLAAQGLGGRQASPSKRGLERCSHPDRAAECLKRMIGANGMAPYSNHATSADMGKLHLQPGACTACPAVPNPASV